MYEEPPGALSPTCPGVDPLVSMCERLFGKSGSFRGEGWFPWDALAKWGITYRCQCWAAIYPHTHRFRIWKPIYDEKTHASEKCCSLHDTGTFLRRFSHAPNCFLTNLTEIPLKIQHFLFHTDQLHSINPVTSLDRKCWLFIAYNDAYAWYILIIKTRQIYVAKRFVFSNKCCQMITIKNIFFDMVRHLIQTAATTQTHAKLAYDRRHSHTVSLLANRKGGWEDEKEEAEVLSVFGCLYVQRHVWSPLMRVYVCCMYWLL